MSYRIEYDFHGMHRYPISRAHPIIKMIAAAFFLAAGIMTAYFAIAIVQAALSGDIPMIRSAADQMVAQIQDGESVRDSVAAFCKDILLP